MQFTLDALDSPDPFDPASTLPPDVMEALHWQAARSPEQVIGEREVILQRLEDAARVMWKEGLCEKWFEGADPKVRNVSATVNGIIMEDLCRAVHYPDFKCVDLFRNGMLA